MKLSPELLVRLRTIGKRAASTFETLRNTYELAEKCIDVQGDFIECGVGRGSQIGAMALACQAKEDNRTIWAYDSYQGIPLAGKHDTLQPGIGKINHNVNVPEKELLKTSGAAVFTVKQVKDHIKEWGLGTMDIRYIEGWFENTLPMNKIKKIALLRLDGDLYSSTKVCLEYLYPKLVKGGYLIIDDYALTGCRKAVVDYAKTIYPRLLNFHSVEGGMGVVYVKK